MGGSGSTPNAGIPPVLLDKEQKLSDEPSQFANADSTWDQFPPSLQYPNAAVHEVLWLHIGKTTRIAAENNMTPFKRPSGHRLFRSDKAGIAGVWGIGGLATCSRFQVEPGRVLTVTLGRAAGAIRNYTFELPDGPGTVIKRHCSILPRPQVAGQDRAKVPLLGWVAPAGIWGAVDNSSRFNALSVENIWVHVTAIDASLGRLNHDS
ncbi:hypothetical protein BD779DRAFT_1787672 [Infundibulicybe gibba]|nr:hypothetical protein BD779DRAFT_1787672 [Infundibulicybe gibba]